MKTQRPNFKKMLSMWILTSTVISVLAACNPGGGGNNNQPAPVVPVCPTCVGVNGLSGGVPLASAISSYPINISWQFSGDQNALSMALPGTTNYANYRGPLYASGQMTIPGSPTAYPGTCTLPTGTYTFGTITPGQMIQGAFVLPQMQASGPVSFTFRVANAVLINPTQTANQVYATILITSVNGAPCSPVSLVVN